MRPYDVLVRAIALIAITSIPTAAAQSSGGDFKITREAIASGGARATAGAYSVVSSTAQPLASGAQGGGAFVLRGGFHVPADASAPGDALFHNGFEN